MNPVYDPPPNTDVAPSRLPRGSKVLVTGATGFIGGRLVERLLQQDDVQVRCVVRDIASAARLNSLPVELVHADLGNAAEINRTVEGSDYVFHCAYDWHSRRQNIDGLRNLVEACATRSVNRLVHVSTFSVYESLPDGPITEEARDGDRSNKYVDTKLDLEEMIFDAVQNRGVAATIVQPTIVYGPFCGPWTNGPAEMLIFGDVILQDGDEGLCNAVYIDDIVDGLLLAAISPAAVGERFIMSGPEPVTWATFFTEMARALGAKPPQFWPRERIAQYQDGHPKCLIKIVMSPKRILKFIVRWNPARKVLKAGVDALPSPLRKMVLSYYSVGSRTRGEIFLPKPWYSWTASAGSEKARLKLGYSPHFDFQRGMELTGRYLEWAYGDLVRSTSTGHHEPPLENTSTSTDIANRPLIK